MADSPASGKSPRRRHARGTAAASRQELLAAAIKLLKQGGTAAVTTAAVTREAGFTQSAFYLHFAGVDECLLEVARQIAARIRTQVDEHRRQAHEPAVGWESLTAHFRAMLALFSEERVFAELYLRHRRDTSALGQVMRRLHRELCLDLTNHLSSAAQAAGVELPADRLQIHAELILAQVLAGGEAVLDRRCPPDRVAEELTLFISAAAQSAWQAAMTERPVSEK